MTIELPRMTLANRAAIAVCVAGALALEAALRRRLAVPPGVGVAAGTALLAWLYVGSLRAARTLRKLTWRTDQDWRLEFRDGRTVDARLGPGTRMIGRTLLLDLRAGGASTRAWLTGRDVDDRWLRAVAVRLACHGGLRAS